MSKKYNRKTSPSMRGGSLIFVLFLLLAGLFAVLQQTDLFDDLMGSFESSENTAQTFTSSGLISDNVDGIVSVHFIDVGQGDSELIQIPKHDGFFNILIDAGTNSSADELVDYLKSRGIDTLDVVIATHPHADHIGGMTKIINNFKISNFYMPLVAESQTPTTKTYEKMLDALIDKDVSTHEIYAGTYIDLPVGTKLQVLSPIRDKNYDNLNNYSAVLRFSHGKNTFLFTGDAEKEAEKLMLENLTDSISSTVLKVGHHGSSTSTTKDFLQAVSPSFAVISCELGNSYGHPHKETISILEEFDCEILRTDEIQTIMFESDGKNLAVNKNLPSAR